LITLTGVIRFTVASEISMHRGYRRVRGDFSAYLTDLDLAPQPIGIDRDALLAALRTYFTHRGFDANWDAIRKLPDDMLVVTLAMVCPFEPAEKQALLEAPADAERAAALLALLQMGAVAPDASGGRSVS
jgi:Lon protease-like protein